MFLAVILKPFCNHFSSFRFYVLIIHSTLPLVLLKIHFLSPASPFSQHLIHPPWILLLQSLPCLPFLKSHPLSRILHHLGSLKRPSPERFLLNEYSYSLTNQERKTKKIRQRNKAVITSKSGTREGRYSICKFCLMIGIENLWFCFSGDTLIFA